MARGEELISQFHEYEEKNEWPKLYQKIRHLSEEEGRKLSTKVSRKVENVDKNRYRDVLAYDHCRIKLEEKKEDGSDYINATPISIDSANREYILSQGPLSNTCDDFWQMVWEQKVGLIIMLNRVIEKNSLKCDQYFPLTVNKEKELDRFRVQLLSMNEKEHFVVRRLRLTLNSEGADRESVELQHFQYTEWPDFGVPTSTIPFLAFLNAIRATGLLEQPNPPTVIHCSAGIGRSGAFLLVDVVLRMLELGATSIDVVDLVVRFRRSRMGLIQTPQQLQFCWKAIVDALNEASSSTSSTPPPVLQRSSGNRLTCGKHAKSVEENMRKRFHESDEDDEDEEQEKDEEPEEEESAAKIARRRRMELVTAMRTRLRQSEARPPSWRRPMLVTAVSVGVVAFAVMMWYRVLPAA